MQSARCSQVIELIRGANGEGRTPIPLREPDPKSGASANSATFASGPLLPDHIIRAANRDTHSIPRYSPCALPQTDTSSPNSRNMAALVARARLAASASGA
jgi:hypothetical protein